MFHCQPGDHLSGRGDAKTVVVMEWRKKEYAAVELPRKFGDPSRRFSRSGSGYEAAVTVDCCPLHLESALAKAPIPPSPKSDITVASIIDKPNSFQYDGIPTALVLGRPHSRFSFRLPSTSFYPMGKVVRLVRQDKDAYLLIEGVRKTSDETHVEVSFRCVIKPTQEVVA